MKDLTKIHFDVKIVDYGLSRILQHGSLAETPQGTPDLIAPEVLVGSYDQRVDVWGVGIITYMMLTASHIFHNETQKTSGKWYIRTDIDYSVEALRFLNETVVYDRERRPFPDRLVDHPYFRCDLSHQATIRERLPELARQELACLNQPQGVPSPPSGSGRKLWFDAKDPSSFDELYQYCTGRANSRIGAPDDAERDARPDSETARSGARSFLSTVNPLRRDSPGSFRRGTLCQYRAGGLRDTTINVDVLLFGDHHAGKKAFMTAFRADDGEPEDRTVSRNKNFEFIDYAKRTV